MAEQEILLLALAGYGVWVRERKFNFYTVSFNLIRSIVGLEPS